ncbi:MAG: hypothetical protein JNM89_08300 [Hyphomicrobiaceae bacterium]|nr:hypothetical protein [Hyphomicrobiaceae bacterium]
MSGPRSSSLRDWMLPGAAVALVVVAVAGTYLWKPKDEPPRECGLTPAAHHQGSFLNWRLSMSPGEGMSGEVSALVKLDDGREVVAYNVTSAGGLSPGDRVTVAEIVCVHRVVYTLTAFGASSTPTN